MLLKCQGQVRVAGMGTVLGLDLLAALRVAVALAPEAQENVLVPLLLAGESGMVAGMHEADQQAREPSKSAP